MSTTTAPATVRKRRTPRPLRPLKRAVKSVLGRTNVVKDADAVTAPTALVTGTANQVARARLRIKLGSSQDAFFKARTDSARAEFAVASSRLARALGLGSRVARNKWAKLGGTLGAVSGKVPGRPLYRLILDTNGTAVGTEYQAVDLSDRRIQKGLSDLQLFDAITGQRDRHGGNIYIDTATGNVSGIDDDLSFEEGSGPAAYVDSPTSDGKYAGMPRLVDAATARRVLALNPDDLPKLLNRTGDPLPLGEQAITGAQERLRAVQQYLRDNPGNWVTSWNNATFQTAVNEPDYTGFQPPVARSYLKRQYTLLQDAATARARNAQFPSWVAGRGVPPQLVPLVGTNP